MNVIVANERQEELANLDIDIIKSITGFYDVSEIVDMFKSFFYSRMILDVTAMKQYTDLRNYEVLIRGLGADKIIFLLPEGSPLCTPNFLGHLISLGIYNFTTNMKGIKYLLKKPNTLQDVEHIRQMAKTVQSNETGASVAVVSSKVSSGTTVIGVKNVTVHAGATTFIYLLKKELSSVYGSDSVVAIEIDKSDFQFFNERNMVSAKESDIRSVIGKYSNANVILVDMNNCKDDSFCGDVLYLIEPSTIQLNKMIRRKSDVFQMLNNVKVVLNKSLLLNNDVFDFEREAGIKVFYNMPPLDERKRNAVVNDFLSRLGLLDQPKRDNNAGVGKIFGLCRR